MSVLSNRSFQLVTLAVALAGAVTVYRSCGDAVIEADREQQKIESSPEVKRQRREAAQQGVEGIDRLYNQTIEDVKLAAVPIVAIVDAGTQVRLNRKYGEGGRVFTALVTDADGLKAAVDRARKAYAGAEISEEEAGKYAATALILLREIALGSDKVYNVMDAQPALVQALSDDRQNIVQQAGGVLALLNSEAAQKALADAALDTARPEETRVSILNSLALSATHFGTRLNEVQLDGLHKLIGSAKGDVALSAARAYGALAQPTSKEIGRAHV